MTDTRLFLVSNSIFTAWAIVYDILIFTCGGKRGAVNCIAGAHVQIYTLSRGIGFLLVSVALAMAGRNFLILYWEDLEGDAHYQMFGSIIIMLVPLCTLFRAGLWLYFASRSIDEQLLPRILFSANGYLICAYTIPCLVPSVLLLVALWGPVTLIPHGNKRDTALGMMMSTMEPLISTDNTGDPNT